MSEYILNDDEIELTLDDGSKQVAKILFYYENPERENKKYFFLYKEETPDDVIVMASKDGVSLEEVSDEEFEEAQEMFETYQNDPKIAEARK